LIGKKAMMHRFKGRQAIQKNDGIMIETKDKGVYSYSKEKMTVNDAMQMIKNDAKSVF
jgi:hypothetical protein